jgi:prephenate dehydrogenase
MTRIAASNVALWSDILAANAGPVADVLDGVIADLTATAKALRTAADDAPLAESEVRRVLESGVAGQHLIPGKHGAEPAPVREVTVIVADRPGELARLFTAVGDASVNLEDIRIEHVFGRPSGLVALFVRPDAGERIIEALEAHDFDVRY